MNYSMYLAVHTNEIDWMKEQWLLMAEPMQAMPPPHALTSPEHVPPIGIKHSVAIATAHDPRML